MEGRVMLSADPVISEFMAVNTNGLMDRDGDYSDWIEIHNPDSSPLSLDGWYLTDSSAELTKWQFPAITLDANGYLVVFASNKDRAIAGQELHTNFKLDGDGEYLGLVKPDGTTVVSAFSPEYLPQEPNIAYGISEGSATEVKFLTQGTQGKALIPSSGTLPDFTSINADETGWTAGPMGVGFDNNPDYLPLIGLNTKTMPRYGTTASVLVRVPFTVDDPSALSGLKLRLKYEDGFVAYLNGQRVAADNAPGTLAWDSTSLNRVNRDEGLAVQWTEFDISNYLNKLVPGKNVLAIQVLNSSTSSSDLLMVPELAGVKLTQGEAQVGYLTTPTPGRANVSQVLNLGPLISDVAHRPSNPNSTNTVYDADDLIVTAKVAPWKNPVNTVTLKYRVMFGSEASLPMFDDGQHGDGAAGDGVYGAVIPAGASAAGDMVRYYVVATDSQDQMSRAPLFASPTGSPEYFGTVIADPAVTSQLPIFQWFVENPNAAATDNGTKASVYYLGQFYDNVHVRIRGGTARGWAKPHFKFDFNPGYHFQYDVNQPRVEEFNLNSIYSDKSAIRTILSWETYRDAGSPYCTAFPMRVQQNGDFYSVAVFVEQPDEDYLVRQGMDPDGAMYKLTTDVAGANFGNNPSGVVNQFEKRIGNPNDKSDLLSLVTAIGNGQKLTGDARAQYLRQYLFDNLDVAQMINSWAVNTIIADNDDAQKNYYLYRDPTSGLWRMLPWDKDLTFGRNFDGGAVLSDTIWAAHDPQSHPLFGDSEHPKIDGAHAWNAIIDALLDVPEIKQMYLRRLRVLMDQLLQAPGTPAASRYYDKRIDELYALMAPDMALDNAKWGQWGTYQNFATGINILKTQYLDVRRTHLYTDHSTNTSYPGYAGIPSSISGAPTINFGTIEYNPASGNQDEEYIELVNPNNYAVDISGWKLGGGVEFTFEAGTVIPANGKVYVSPNIAAFRARTSGPRGGQGLIVTGPYKNQLSAWGEQLTLSDAAGNNVQTFTYVGNPTAAQQALRITEVMYNPAASSNPADPAKDEFEFVELQNISDQPLNLLGVQFTAGIDYTFGNITLQPKQYIVVVKNQAAFESRYGVGVVNIAGVYPTKYLNNGGDTIQLKDASGEEILDFHYDPTWYASTDGAGKSLVIIDAAAPIVSWQTKENWRASTQIGGSPGRTDSTPDTTAPTADIVDVSPDPRNTSFDTITIRFSEAVSGFDLADLRLTRDGGVNLLTGGQTLATTDNITWTLGNLIGLTNLSGSYALTLAAGGVVDLAGNALAAAASEDFVIDRTAPTMSITPVAPDPRNTSVGSIQIVFSEPVVGLTAANLSLVRDGGSNLLSGSQSLTSSDGKVWILSGLGGLTALEGKYTLTVASSGSIKDLAGNGLSNTPNETFTVDKTAPIILSIDAVSPDPRNTPVDSITIRFNEAMSGFGLGSLSLIRNGETIPLIGSAATLTKLADNKTWTLGNLSSLTAAEGQYFLKLPAAGATDLAGNPLDEGWTTAFRVDTTAPTATVRVVTPDPRNSALSVMYIDFSESVSGLSLSNLMLTRGGTWPKVPNLLTGSETLFGGGDQRTWTISGLAPLTQVDGTYTLTVSPTRITDRAGNAMVNGASASFTIDKTAPAAQIVMTPDPDHGSIGSMGITFNESVAGFDLSDLRLSRDGGANLLTAAQTLSSSNGKTWTLSNLAGLTERLGTYVLTLGAAGSGIVDSAGNALAADATGSYAVASILQTGAIRLQRSADDANLMEVYTGGSATLDYSVAFAALPQIHIAGQSGADQLTLDFSNGNMLPAGGLAFDGLAGSDSLKVKSTGNENLLVNNAGITVGTAPITFANVEDVGWDVASGSSLTIGGSVAMSLDVSTELASLTLTDSAILTMAAGRNTVLKLGGLSIGTNAKLDLADNDLIIRDGDLAAISNWIKSARTGGTWTGNGLTSSAAKARAAAKQAYTGLAVVRNEKNGKPILTTFAGQAVGLNDILVKYTWNGDVNLDGVIDAADYFLVDSGFITQQGGYRNGDLNFDGAVDAGDYFLIDSAFIGQPPLVLPAVEMPVASAADDVLVLKAAAVPTPQVGSSVLQELFSVKPVL